MKKLYSSTLMNLSYRSQHYHADTQLHPMSHNETETTTLMFFQQNGGLVSRFAAPWKQHKFLKLWLHN